MNLRRCFSADFETTTDENDCRVWAYALCNIDDPTDFRYGNSIEDFIKFCADPKINYKLWFHNLKFDSSYVLSFLLSSGYTWISDRKEKADKTFTTLISSLGQYYNVTIYFKVKGHHTNKVEIYDSLKIFPNFSVERVAEAFKMPIRKLELDYHAKREKGHILTKEEVDYIRNDVEIMARALREMFSRGLTKMTIASDAINDYKENHIKDFRRKFPKLPKAMDEDIRSAYRGGFTYASDVWREKKVGTSSPLDLSALPHRGILCRGKAHDLQRPKPQGSCWRAGNRKGAALRACEPSLHGNPLLMVLCGSRGNLRKSHRRPRQRAPS